MDMHIYIHGSPIFGVQKSNTIYYFGGPTWWPQAYYLVPLLSLPRIPISSSPPNLLCETSQNALVANSKITVLIQSPSLQNNYLNKTKENKKVPISLLHMHGPQFHIHSLVSPTKRQKTMAPFDCTNKSAEKHCWLNYCKRKILFWLKKQVEKDNL
jgi:hypothetical protein